MTTKMLCEIPEKARVIETCADRVAIFLLGKRRESWFKKIKIYGVSWNYTSSPLNNGSALSALTNDIWNLTLHDLSRQHTSSKALKLAYGRSLGACGHVHGLDEAHAQKVFAYLNDTLEVMVAKALVLQEANPFWGFSSSFAHLSYQVDNQIYRSHFEHMYRVEIEALHQREQNQFQDEKLLDRVMQSYPQTSSQTA